MKIAIVLSGGVGSRVGAEVPKQYIIINNKPIISYSVRTIAEYIGIERLIIVAALEWRDFIKENLSGIVLSVDFASPGVTRQHSVYNALKVAKEIGVQDSDVVLIHDGARPLLSSKLIDDCFRACETFDGALPVIPVKDTIYQSENGIEISSLLDRSKLFAGQAPESFVFGKYFKIHEEKSYSELCEINGSTEIAFKHGLNIKLIKGDEMNFKITTPEDLKSFETIVYASECSKRNK